MVSKIKQVFTLIVCSLILVPASRSTQNESTFLGVTEPSHTLSAGEKVKTPFVIRVAFQYKNGVWTTLPNKAGNPGDLYELPREYPKEIDWNLGLDGKQIGNFGSHCPAAWSFYSEVGLEEPDAKTHIPAIKTGAKNFHYWGDPWAVPVHNRPLVASSGLYVDDPDNWKPLVPLPHPTYALITAYRKAVGSDAKSFRSEQILVTQCYRSRHGDELINLAVPSSEVEGAYDYVRCFHVRGSKINLLGSSLELIDAGDYDHDGHSEIVFHKGDYNYDAYVLLYGDPQKQLEFGWSYH